MGLRRIKHPAAIRPAWDTPHRRDIIRAALDLAGAYGRNSSAARQHERVLLYWLRRAGLEHVVEWEPWQCPTCGCGSPELEIEQDLEHQQRMAAAQARIEAELAELRKAGGQ